MGTLAFLLILLYLMVVCTVLLAGLFALPHDDDFADSIIFPMAMFWPLSIIGLCFYLLLRSSGVLEADHERQQRRRAEASAKESRT